MQIIDWKVKVEFPRQCVEVQTGSGDIPYEETSTTYSAEFARMYPGDRKEGIVHIAYHIDESNYGIIKATEPTVKLRL